MRCKGIAHSLSLDMFDQWKTMEKGHGKWRFTSPTHVVRAFKQALAELIDARYCENHRILMEGMRVLGFETLLDDAIQSPIITSFLYPHAAFDFKAFYHGQCEPHRYHSPYRAWHWQPIRFVDRRSVYC